MTEDVAFPVLSQEGKGPASSVDSGNIIVTHSLRADGFDASEDGTRRGTPLTVIPFDERNVTSPANRSRCLPDEPCHTLHEGAPAVAFNWQNGGGYGDAHDGLAVSEEHTPPMSRSQVAAVAISAPTGVDLYNQAITGTITHTLSTEGVPHILPGVRRLTPRECERLQAFPDIAKSAIIAVCGEKQKNAADAVLQSLRLQGDASPAEESALKRFAPFVESNSPAFRPDLAIPADVTVLIDSERGATQIHSRGRSLWSASDVDDGSWSLLPMGGADFVRLAVHTIQSVERETSCGEAASHQNSVPSVLRLRGNVFAVLSGRGIDDAADDAGRNTTTESKPSTSTTSRATVNSPRSGSSWQTLCSSVVRAIASFIPEPTWRESGFVLRLTVVSPWTRYGREPDGTRYELADGPRYKCMGNAVTVSVAHWLGRRLAAAGGERGRG